MTTRIVETTIDLDRLLVYLTKHSLPMTVTVAGGKHRTEDQNRLQFMWFNEIADQWDGHTTEDVRAYCKLVLGVPILRAENETFRAAYDDVVKPLNYEQKLKLMTVLDFPVTRLMTTKQLSAYLDEITRHFAERGIELTQPEGV